MDGDGNMAKSKLHLEEDYLKQVAIDFDIKMKEVQQESKARKDRRDNLSPLGTSINTIEKLRREINKMIEVIKD